MVPMPVGSSQAQAVNGDHHEPTPKLSPIKASPRQILRGTTAPPPSSTIRPSTSTDQRIAPAQTTARQQLDWSSQRIYLHVYDLGPVSRWALNSWSGHQPGLGAFHCGVEVLGVEWSFQALMDVGDNEGATGITCHAPKCHPRHGYRESVFMGDSPMRRNEIARVLIGLERSWPARRYHFINNNCTDFAECISKALRAPNPFPSWVHGLAKSALLRKAPLDGTGLGPRFLGSCSCSASSASGDEEREKAVAFEAVKQAVVGDDKAAWGGA